MVSRVSFGCERGYLPSCHGYDQVHHHQEDALEPMGFTVGNEIVYLALFSNVVLVVKKAVDVPAGRQQIAESLGRRRSTKSTRVSNWLLSECVDVAYHVIVA